MPQSSHVRVKHKGQVTIPSDLRSRLGIAEGDILEVQEREGEIVLKPAPPLKGGEIVGEAKYKQLVDELEQLRRRWR